MTAAPVVFDRPAVDWERGRGGRPKIKPPTGAAWPADASGRVSATREYTRVTTFAGALDDSHGLVDWKAAQALLGASRRPDYLMGVAACQSWDQDKATLRELVGKCADAAPGDDAATIGTALHSFTERIDRGEPLGFLPEPYRPHIERYRQLVAPLTFTHHEVRTVCDQLEVAGTPDRFGFCSLPDPDGVVDKLRVVDTKSGKLDDYRVPKISAQLAIYAHSDLYDPATGARTPLENLDRTWGLIVHLPAKASAAELEAGAGGLYWVDLRHGWAGAEELAGRVREWRKVKGLSLLVPAALPAEQSVTEAAPEQPSLAPPEVAALVAARSAIVDAVHTTDLTALWQKHAADWGQVQELVDLMRQQYDNLTTVERLAAPRAALLGAIATAGDVGDLAALWGEHGGTELWTDEHDAAATARHRELNALAA